MIGDRVIHISRHKDTGGYGLGIIISVDERDLKPDILMIQFDSGKIRKVVRGPCIISQQVEQVQVC